jgi:hypothetical protein
MIEIVSLITRNFIPKPILSYGGYGFEQYRVLLADFSTKSLKQWILEI